MSSPQFADVTTGSIRHAATFSEEIFRGGSNDSGIIDNEVFQTTSTLVDKDSTTNEGREELMQTCQDTVSSTASAYLSTHDETVEPEIDCVSQNGHTTRARAGGTSSADSSSIQERTKNRLVLKDGSSNVVSRNVFQRKTRYLVDLFTTFVDMQWRYNLFMFGGAFIGSWLFFSFIWWIIAIAHDDHQHIDDSNWVPCVDGVYDFPTAFLFSLETQHTIGYGTRAMEPQCSFAIIILMLQSCLGVFIQSLMTGLIFAKLSRPKGRSQTIMFSRQAVICQRDGEYCLLFRLGDMRKSYIIGTTIRALIVKNRRTAEGEEIPMCKYRLQLETEAKFDGGFIFIVWPVTVAHRIDANSPLWELSKEGLGSEQFEIIIILEGVIESTGHTAQFRTSYLPDEILWGHRLTPLHTHQKPNGQYDVDYTHFHSHIPVDSMPPYSAKEHFETTVGSPSLSKLRKAAGGYLPNFSVGGPVIRSSGLYRRISVSLLSKKRLSSA